MARALALMLAALLAVAVAACGDGDGGGATTAAAAEEPHPDAAGLRRYLDAVQPHVRTYERLRVEANAILDRVNRSAPDESWDGAAAGLERVRDDYRRLAAKVQDVEAPTRVRRAHSSFVESLALFGRIADTLSADLAAHDRRKVADWATTVGALTEEARGLLDDWQAATLAAARVVGVAPPAWLGRVGTGQPRA